jgi:calcineurin-like phosphoesterase family protein
MSEIPQFVTADSHLGHGAAEIGVGRTGILKHTDRPWNSVPEQDEALIANWNETVPNRAVVAILGDFAWRDHAKYLNRLNGKKILITGSHDRMSLDALRLFKEVHEAGAMLNFGNQRLFWCSHTCCRIWERGHYLIGHLFGHSHGRLETYNMSVDVGVDSGRVGARYRPLPIEDIVVWMSRREAMMRETGRIVEERGKTLARQDDVWWLDNQIKRTAVPVAADTDQGC